MPHLLADITSAGLLYLLSGAATSLWRRWERHQVLKKVVWQLPDIYNMLDAILRVHWQSYRSFEDLFTLTSLIVGKCTRKNLSQDEIADIAAQLLAEFDITYAVEKNPDVNLEQEALDLHRAYKDFKATCDEFGMEMWVQGAYPEDGIPDQV